VVKTLVEFLLIALLGLVLVMIFLHDQRDK
jgi:hypothetical protein